MKWHMKIGDSYCCRLEKGIPASSSIWSRSRPQGGFHPPPVAAAPIWCICFKCRDMPKKVERICCGRPANHCQSQSLVSYHHFNMLTIITVTLLEVIILVGRFIKVICKFKNIHQFFSSSFYVDNIDT